MKRTLRVLLTLLASRAVTPMVILCFLLLYIGIAFFNDEPLMTLIALTRDLFPVTLLLAVIPVNSAVQLVMESVVSGRRRKLLKGGASNGRFHELFDESLDLPGNAPLSLLKSRLESFGYHVRLTGSSLAAWRGITLFPARALFLAAMVCLFTGIILSTTMRISHRVPVIEGEPFPHSSGAGDTVTRIALQDYPGLFLNRTLSIDLSGRGGNRRSFGLYPPSLVQGEFVYPRYLGIAPLVHFSAPDLQAGIKTYYILMIYPPGKEDSAEIAGTGYRIGFSMASPEAGDEPFGSGRFSLIFKIMKGDQPVASGTLPMGGEFNGKGYRLSLPEFRRVVATDLVRDYGVLLIWTSLLLFPAALLFWLPVRLFYPRREMLFFEEADSVHACSLAEGGRKRHGGVFHEALDLLAPQAPEAGCNENVEKPAAALQ